MKWPFLFFRPVKACGFRPTVSMAAQAGTPPPRGARIRRLPEPGLLWPAADGRLALASWVEIMVLAGLLPAALFWFAQPQSLLLLFPVLVLMPLLLGVNYGFFAGTGSALLTVAVLAAIGLLKPDLLKEFPKAQSIGMVLVGMCAGEARDIWAARLRRTDYLCHYHQTRLKQFTSAYQLLQVSHSQLERRMAGNTNSLRSALERLELHQPACDGAGDEPLGGMAGWLLEIMVEAGGLHTAAVYEISGKGVLRLPCLAMAGQAADLSPFNPLLRETLRTASLTSVHASLEALHEHVIAIVPLVDASGHIHGIVSIHDMPFLSVHQETFELLAVLGRHIGDILMRRTRPVGESQVRFALRESLESNLMDAKKNGLPAALIACRVVDADCRQSLVNHCCNSSRGLDQSWLAVNRQGESVIVKLLPLTDEAGV
ncbi:MAG: hypothetical protein JWP77_1950, partial [Polaromonas sp.]|nr:hypothetical protein [Polaromonas sp.]